MIISNSTQSGMLNNNTSSILPHPSFYGTQQTNPFTQQALHSTTSNNNQTSVVLCSREDHSRYLKDLELKNRHDRLKLVREQEKLASRQLLQDCEERRREERERQREEARYEDYLAKKREIEQLRALRELEVERQGRAMRDAEEAEERRLREMLEAKEKAIRDEGARRGRGKAAVEKERRLAEEKREIEEAIKQIERKRMVASQEQMIAREAAQKYREQQSVYDESKMQQSSKMAGVAADVSTLKSVSHVDYTNTRFHNAVVVKSDQFLQNELEKLKKGAYDKAKEEQTKKSIMKAQKENQNRINQEKAIERGKRAMNEQLSKKDKELFEREMHKLQVQENLQKIHEAKRGEEPAAMTVMQERKERQKQEKMMKIFEEEVIKKETKSKSRERVNSNNEHQPLRQRENKQQPAIVIKVEERSKEDELQMEHARNIMALREQQQQHQPSMFSNYDHIRTYNDKGLSSQSLNQSSVNQTAPRAFAQNNGVGSDFTLKEDFNQRSNNYYSPQSDTNQQIPQSSMTLQAQHQQYNAFPNPQPDRSYNQAMPSSSQNSSNTNLNNISNPFFVPTPSSQPRVAPAHSNALPQYFNPYLQQQQQQQQQMAQVLDQDQAIKIQLNHPKQQMTNVDEFLQDNQEYLEDKNEEDSENPDEYGDEDDDYESSMTDNNEAMSSSSGSSMTSIVQSPSNGQQSIEGAYRMDQIDRIIREARQNKKEMLQQQVSNDTSSGSKLSESFDDKYLQKYSAISQNQAPRQNSNLADEFLKDDHDSSLQVNSQQHYQSDLLTKSSYLKQSAPQQISTIEQQKRPIFDYAAQTKHQFKMTSGQVDLNDNAPMSELSYSYSEMPGGIHQFGQQSQYNGTTLNQSKGPFQSTQTRENMPLRNKGGVKLEIVEGNETSNNTDQSQKSLADIFKERRGIQRETNEERPREKKPEKTKEELALIRKQMMKARPSQQSNQSINSSSGTHNITDSIDSGKPVGKNSELMSRLARGERVEVSKKDMLKLTNKNYEMLPEVRKKKEDERKKEEMKERMKQVKELEKQRRELRSAGSSHRQSSQRK